MILMLLVLFGCLLTCAAPMKQMLWVECLQISYLVLVVNFFPNDLQDVLASTIWHLLFSKRILLLQTGIGDPCHVVFHLPNMSTESHTSQSLDIVRLKEKSVSSHSKVSDELLIYLLRLLKKFLADDSVEIVDITSRTLRVNSESSRPEAHNTMLVDVVELAPLSLSFSRLLALLNVYLLLSPVRIIQFHGINCPMTWCWTLCNTRAFFQLKRGLLLYHLLIHMRSLWLW